MQPDLNILIQHDCFHTRKNTQRKEEKKQRQEYKTVKSLPDVNHLTLRAERKINLIHIMEVWMRRSYLEGVWMLTRSCVRLLLSLGVTWERPITSARLYHRPARATVCTPVCVSYQVPVFFFFFFFFSPLRRPQGESGWKRDEGWR